MNSPNNLVVAACRSPEKATALHGLKTTAKGTLHLVQLDVSDFDSIRAAAKPLEAILGEIGLDYLINNAAIVRVSLRLSALNGGTYSTHRLPFNTYRRFSIPRSPSTRKISCAVCERTSPGLPSSPRFAFHSSIRARGR